MSGDQNSRIPYKGYEIEPRPLPLKDGDWTTEVYIWHDDIVTPYFAKDRHSSEDVAIKICVEFARQIIDGEIHPRVPDKDQT